MHSSVRSGEQFHGESFQTDNGKAGSKTYGIFTIPSSKSGLSGKISRSLKRVLTKFCLENDKDWYEGVQVALYALHLAKKDSQGYSLFELLMFAKKPREGESFMRLV